MNIKLLSDDIFCCYDIRYTLKITLPELIVQIQIMHTFIIDVMKFLIFLNKTGTFLNN